MFSRGDFWIGMAVGVVAGIVGYKYAASRNASFQPATVGTAEVPMAELIKQKEELEDMIAAQEAAKQEK
ncbi:50S ribosomal protein L9 [Pectinatus cerevisiiphilus]|uniref:50S ribosomal protein L9 n=1 Tax=Pectinatus cerevisiiphilus TaxID=86956 RepID=A0A4R3KEW4_9FIRM|nr:50S ribosomal protein L9 [Pectinatus cerevisiiphilus]TCS81906.1 hypothetical protein EDC37_10177 [Pectinatus cerevisiiphilus]